MVREVELPAVAIVFARVGLAAAGLGVVLAVAGRHRAAGPRLLSIQPGRCVLVAATLAAHWCALFAAYQRAPVGTVLFIVYLAPVGIALIAPSLLGETVRRHTVFALVIALAGFSLLTGPAVDAAGSDGLALAGLACVLFVALIVLSTPLARAYGGLRLAFLEMAGAALLLSPVAALVQWGQPQPEWAWLLVLGFGHSAVGIVIYLDSLARVGATTTGIVGYVEPASAAFWAWLVLNEQPGLATIAGGVLIFAAGILVVRSPAALEVPVDVSR